MNILYNLNSALNLTRCPFRQNVDQIKYNIMYINKSGLKTPLKMFTLLSDIMKISGCHVSVDQKLSQIAYLLYWDPFFFFFYVGSLLPLLCIVMYACTLYRLVPIFI